jgi:ribosomal protein S18 acetylase RimI-like enzyme
LSERPPAGLVIAALRREDSAALAALFERNRTRGTAELFDPFELTAERAAALAADRCGERYFLARLDGEAVAFSMLRGHGEGFAVPSFGILVDESQRGRGIGRALTSATLDVARSAGAQAVRLSVYARNDAAIALYRSLGFTEREHGSVPRPDGPRERIVMVLEWGPKP